MFEHPDGFRVFPIRKRQSIIVAYPEHIRCAQITLKCNVPYRRSEIFCKASTFLKEITFV